MLKVTGTIVGLGLAAMLGMKTYVDTRPVMVQYYGEIRGDAQYFKLLTVLREAHYGQRIDIYMISPGGSVLHGNELATAMRESHGHVVYHIGSLAASMAAVLACQADELDIAPSGIIMFHTLQRGDGSGPILNPSTPDEIAFHKAMVELMRHCKFVTTQEVKDMNAGAELWLTGNDVHDRLNKSGEQQNGNI